MMQRDMIIRCSHGEQGAPGSLVQRFRWVGGELGAWVPTIRRSVQVTDMRGKEVDQWQGLAMLSGRGGTIEAHVELTCMDCLNSVSMRDNHLHSVFQLFDSWSDTAKTAHARAFAELAAASSDRAVTVTVDGLRAALRIRRELRLP